MIIMIEQIVDLPDEKLRHGEVKLRSVIVLAITFSISRLSHKTHPLTERKI